MFGLASSRAQSRLLEMKGLTFEKAIQVATSMELSEKDTLQLQNGTTTTVEYIGIKDKRIEKKALRKRKSTTKNTKGKSGLSNKNNKTNVNHPSNLSCFRCGSSYLVTKCTLDMYE